MLLSLISAAAFIVLTLIVLIVCSFIQCKIEDRAYDWFEKWGSLEREKFWGYVRAGHARRKRVEKILKRERARAAAAELEYHEQVLRMAIRHGEVLDDLDRLKAQNQQLSDNHASLVDDVMTKLLKIEQVSDAQVDVTVSRLRRPKR